MKPFNIDAAKRGEKVITRCGRPARIIYFDAKGRSPIVALIDMGNMEFCSNFRTDGTSYEGFMPEEPFDLLMNDEDVEVVFDRKVLDSEDKNRITLLPFNLFAAKMGAALVTRDGRSAQLLKSDCKGYKPLVVLVENKDGEYATSFSSQGRVEDSEDGPRDHPCDLFIVGLKANY